VIGTAQLAALFGAPLFGFIGDRIDRLNFLLLGFTIAAIGYGWVGSLADLRGLAAVPALLCLGLGLSATSMSSTVLLGQEAPAEVRGSAFGLLTFFGSLGILAISEGGGRLFDGIGPGAPFLAVSIANTVVLALGVALRLHERRQARGAGG
jgi:MFS family permease